MLDKTGRLLEAGQNVFVPNHPNDKDNHTHSFIGYVVDVLEDRDTVIVEDKCSEFFEIEAERVVIQEEEH
jgi:hypothetical protein